MFATDHLAAGEPARCARPAAHGPRHGRSLLRAFRQVPKRIVLDIDDTFDAVHGGQQLRLFNAHHDEYGFQPIVVFDGEGRLVAAVLRPAKRPGGKEIRAFLRRLLRAIRANWPRTEILLRADSHYCCPEVLDFCRAEGLDFILGVAPTTTLRRHVEGARGQHESPLRGRAEGWQSAPLQGVLRRRRELEPRRADHRPRRGRRGGPDTRFVVTNLKTAQRPQALRGCLLPARPGGKPHQILEDASGGRPHLVHAGHGQPVAPVPARRRLLAHVGPAPVDAEAFDVARGAVRHVAPAPDQNRRARRRDENDDPRPPAVIVSRAAYLELRARTYPAPDLTEKLTCARRPSPGAYALSPICGKNRDRLLDACVTMSPSLARAGERRS